VEHIPAPKDTDFGVRVTLADGAVWHVSGTSYLNELTVGEGCRVDGALTVDGKPVDLSAGTYTGKLVLIPAKA